MKDLTKGKPSTLILAFALPIFFANLLQLTYSLVDTRIVGTFLGEDALAAVGATTTLSNLIIGFLQGLSGGFAIIIAQKFGAKDYKKVIFYPLQSGKRAPFAKVEKGIEFSRRERSLGKCPRRSVRRKALKISVKRRRLSKKHSFSAFKGGGEKSADI